MLSILRKKAQSPVIQATVLIIALVFIFWGVGSNRQGGRNAVATVNGEAITFQDYQKTYDQDITRLRNQFGGDIPKGLLDSLDIKSQVLNQLTQRILLRQGAEEMGIQVSKKEIRQSIEEMEAFRVNDTFNLQQYEAILAASRMTPADFEASMQSDLLTTKVLDNIGRFTKVADNEVMARFLFNNEQIRLSYVSFAPADFTGKVKVDDEQLASYYEENQEKYKTDPQIKLHYLVFSPENQEAQPEISAEEIQAYYDKNIDKYSTPEQRWARHILIKVSPEDTEKVKEQKRQKAEEVRQMALAGDNFAELAKQYSEGPSAGKGGDLGLFPRGRMIKPFDDAVFAMKPGEVSQIVETSFGYHIIKLEDIIPAVVKPLDEVREQIRTTLARKTSKNQTFAAASKAYEDIILAGSMEKYAASGDAKVMETDFFSRNSPPVTSQSPTQKIVADPAFLNAAFSLQKGELSSLVEIGSDYVILYVQDLKPPEIQPLEKVRQQVQNDYIAAHSEKLAREAAENLLAALKSDGNERKNWETAVTDLHLEVKDTGLVKRDENASDAGKLSPAVIEKGFRLSATQPYPKAISENNGNFIVYKLDEKIEPENALGDEKREKLRSQLLEEKKRELLTAWIENRKSKADITVNQKLM
jgi:peptidyl-prolyl cis-trans isomerase D